MGRCRWRAQTGHVSRRPEATPRTGTLPPDGVPLGDRSLPQGPPAPAGNRRRQPRTVPAVQDHDADSFYEVTLTVTDSGGLSTAASRRLGAPSSRPTRAAEDPQPPAGRRDRLRRPRRRGAGEGPVAAIGFRANLSAPEEFKLGRGSPTTSSAGSRRAGGSRSTPSRTTGRRCARSTSGASKPLDGLARRGRGSIRTPGLRTAFGSSSAFAARRASGEGVRALAVIPGPVIAADRVVVGDRAAGVDHRVGDGRLDLVPLGDLVAAPRRREHRVVGRRAVRVDVGEAAADPRRAGALGRARRRPRRPPGGPLSITSAWKSAKRSQVIAVSKVSERTPQATIESRR